MHFDGLISKLMVLLIKEEMHRGNVHASVALQQTILTYVHTKCPCVALYLFELFFVVVDICIRVNARAAYCTATIISISSIVGIELSCAQIH